jgi:peptidoglycan/xylan/chitin deacetylase (PgdA/CDA1 family)
MVPTLTGTCGRANVDPIHLTFDDGPDAELTPRVLDTLARRDVSGHPELTP